MLHTKIEIGKGNAFATTYFHESNPEKKVVKRPVVVICPGGGYSFISYREGEPIALQFVARGYHSLVLHYSIAPEARYPVALTELGEVIKLLRERANEWHIDTEKIIIMGFSAGGHLVASYSCFWKRDFLSQALRCDSKMLRPNGLMLGYPVITSGKFASIDSFHNLLGERFEELKREMSLENQVSMDNPPTFLWHTKTDDDVPVENSIIFAEALKAQGVDAELHIFPEGRHGLALSNAVTAMDETQIVPSCQSWVELALNWINRSFGELSFKD